ncbi:MAG: aspartate aminotransferase family protein [Firmicutes bacterium]|jgi:4-aminobutyrate aminotransferase|nr:aspartate aminotransferase family protein [Bacillota bacterium]
MAIKVDLDPGMEHELDDLSFKEAPKIVSEVPGPRSREILAAEMENETPTRVTPTVLSTVWEESKGATVKDPDGNIFIDLTAGIAVNNVGHCHPRVVETIRRECGRLMHNPDATTAHRAQLGKKLREIAPGELKGKARVAYGLSGSSAVEIATKFARGVTGKSHIIAFHGAYHGVMGSTLGYTTSQQFRANYRPLNPFVYHVGPYAYCYRCPWKMEYPQCDLECARYVEHLLLSPSTGIDIESVAAMVVEPIQGEGGYVPPPDGFVNALKNICEKAGIFYIDDEVQAGMGRTGKMFAIDHYGITPDFITLGKALGGDLPFSAVIMREEIAENLGPMSHILTAAGNATSCAVACTNLDLLQDGIVDRAEKLGHYTLAMLKEMMNEIEIIGDVRGKGMMIAIELVRNRDTREPLDYGEILQLLWALRDRGVLFLPCGQYSNVFRMMPPLVITRELIDKALEIIREVLKDNESSMLA